MRVGPKVFEGTRAIELESNNREKDENGDCGRVPVGESPEEAIKQSGDPCQQDQIHHREDHDPPSRDPEDKGVEMWREWSVEVGYVRVKPVPHGQTPRGVDLSSGVDKEARTVFPGPSQEESADKSLQEERRQGN